MTGGEDVERKVTEEAVVVGFFSATSLVIVRKFAALIVLGRTRSCFNF